jgi:hypothetical protein
MKQIYHIYWDIADWFNGTSNYRVVVNPTEAQLKEFEQELYVVVPCSYLLSKLK